MKRIFLLIFIYSNLVQAQFSEFTLCNSNTSNELYDIHFVDENVGIAVGKLGTIIRSIDGGLNWNSVFSDATISRIIEVDFFDALNGIAISESDVILKTNDGGLNWVTYTLPNSGDLFDIEILNGNDVLVSSRDTSIFKSTDKGSTWNVLVQQFIDPFSNESLLQKLSFINENIGFATVDYTRNIYMAKTLDGGQAWELITTQTGEGLTVNELFEFISEDIGFRGGWYDAQFTKTMDGGLNWQKNDPIWTSLTQPEIYGSHIEINQPNAFYVFGKNMTAPILFQSTNQGNSWIELGGFPVGENPQEIFFINALLGWIILGNDIYKTTTGGEVLNVDNYNDIEFILYPNPTKGILKIQTSKNTLITSISIVNQLGQIVLNPGFEESVNVSSLVKGVYFLKIQIGFKRVIRKFILQ